MEKYRGNELYHEVRNYINKILKKLNNKNKTLVEKLILEENTSPKKHSRLIYEKILGKPNKALIKIYDENGNFKNQHEAFVIDDKDVEEFESIKEELRLETGGLNAILKSP